MDYQRYLRNADYQRSISQQHFNQCFDQKKPFKINQCEMDAEVKVIEFLSQMYEIEDELIKGKSIPNYDKRIAFLEGSYFWNEDIPFRAIRDILGVVRPYSEPYWVEIDMYDLSEVPTYNQFSNYDIGDIVKRKNIPYKCLIGNGYDFDNVRIPYPVDTKHWSGELYFDFVSGENHSVGSYVKYLDDFYHLTTEEGYLSTVTPDKLPCFTKVPAYSDDIPVNIGDYVGFQGELFKCLANVNADTPALKVNIVQHDPRNHSLVKHMVEISLYYSFSEFAANNLPQARVNAYEMAESWLKDASRLRIDPQLERKKSKKGTDETLHAMSQFVNSSQYKDNTWAI